MIPSLFPSSSPSDYPSFVPSKEPTSNPSSGPSMIPSNVPSLWPTSEPSVAPSENPSRIPSSFPSHAPSESPSFHPSGIPSNIPSTSLFPSLRPSVDCSPIGSTLKIEIAFDNYPGETSWKLFDSANTELISRSGFTKENTFFREIFCLEPKTYQFVIYDSFNDGICCRYGDGEFNVFIDGSLVNSGGQFQQNSTFSFEVN